MAKRMTGFRQSPFLSDLENEAYRLIKLAKERWEEAVDDDVIDMSSFRSAREKIKKITGQRNKGFFYSSVEKLSHNDLKLLVNQYKRFLASPQTTRDGRAEMMKNAREAFKSNTNYTDKDYLIMWDIFSTDAYSKMLEAGLMDSDDVITMVLESDKSKTAIEIARNFEIEITNHLNAGKKWKSEKEYTDNTKNKKRKRK